MNLVRRTHRNERGAVLVFTALSIVLMVSVLALVIDLGDARQVRRAAQAGADASALAGGQVIQAYGGSFTGSTAQWSAVVAQVQAYAKANFNVATSAWTGCQDSSPLAYKPDSANNDTCISADYSAWPAWVSGETTRQEHLRVRLPTRTVSRFFAGAVGDGSLSTQAASTTVITRTTQTISTTEDVAGGPCAICLLGSGLTLDGQNGDIAVTGGDVVVDSTSNTASSLNPNGHVTISTIGADIGGPGSCTYPTWCDNFSGSGYSPAVGYHAPVADPLANVQECGNGNTFTQVPYGTIQTTDCQGGGNLTASSTTLSPGIYSTISGSHTLSPGIYVITGGITLHGNDLLQGSGVMLYFACSTFPTPCAPGATGAAITSTGNGALHLSPPTTGSYKGMMYFADRNNTSTSTFRGNGTNENGGVFGSYGTIYMKTGVIDLRGNGFTLDSQIVAGGLTMKGNPSGITIAYAQDYNYSESHTDTTTSTATSYNDNGLSG